MKKITDFFKGSASSKGVKKDNTGTANSVEERFERCVLCGTITTVEKSTPIELREDYELGCGQLCHLCRMKLEK